MRRLVTAPLRRGLRGLGYDVVRAPAEQPGRAVHPADFDAHTVSVIECTADFTLTSPERVAALVEAVRYLVRSGVPGAFCECGVWRGGSMMAVALTLMDRGVDDRDLYMFDTFTHMPFPGEHDVTFDGRRAADFYDEACAAEAYRYLPFDEVKAALASTGYPLERMHFVRGMVEETIPAEAPPEIALCRLDTDWYESTAHELEHLYPRISAGGVLLIDDYGEFMGAKKAVDEYIAQRGLPVLLNRIDFTGRLVVVPGLPTGP